MITEELAKAAHNSTRSTLYEPNGNFVFSRQRGGIKGQTHKLIVQNLTVKIPVT